MMRFGLLAGWVMGGVLVGTLAIRGGDAAGTAPTTQAQTLPAATAATTTAPVPTPDLPEAAKGNSNILLKEYRGRVTVTASSYWPGWEPGKAIDGVLTTSWFTERGDAAALDAKPWIKLAFPDAVTVKRVTVLGNREPAWLSGFTVKAGRLDLLDGDGRVLWSKESVGAGERGDYDFVPEKAVQGVKSVRLELRDDQGKENSYADVAIGEMLVE